MGEIMMREFDLVLFDLDGTLIATAPEICDAVNDTLRNFNLTEVTEKQVNDWIGYGTRELLIQSLAATTSTSVSAVRSGPDIKMISAEFDTHYQNRCGTRSHLYPQVTATLLALRGLGVKLAVVTNKEARHSAKVLLAHNLHSLFDVVISGDTLVTKKPDPAGVISCLAQFGVTKNRALFVGDSSIDVATARNAGVRVFALPYGYNMGRQVQDSHPDRVMANISELLN